MTQPGDPTDPTYQPLWCETSPTPPAGPGFSEPNGYHLPMQAGTPIGQYSPQNDYRLPAGPYRLREHTQRMRQYGHAALDVAVHPGQTTEPFVVGMLLVGLGS